MFLGRALWEAGGRASSVFNLSKQACVTENPVCTYLSGTSQKDLPSTDELLSEISPMIVQDNTPPAFTVRCVVLHWVNIATNIKKANI